MQISPLNREYLSLLGKTMDRKGSTTIVNPIELTKEIIELGIADLINAYFSKNPLPNFDGTIAPDDYIYFVEINKFEKGSDMFTQFKQPHITIIIERRDEKGVRAVSINPRDYSLGRGQNIRLNREQYEELKKILNENCNVNINGLLRYESTQ